MLYGAQRICRLGQIRQRAAPLPRTCDRHPTNNFCLTPVSTTTRTELSQVTFSSSLLNGTTTSNAMELIRFNQLGVINATPGRR